MRRYRQPPPPPRSTRRLIGKVFGWIMLALVVVASGLAGGLYLYGHETLNAIAPHTAGRQGGAAATSRRSPTRPSLRPRWSSATTSAPARRRFGAKDSRSDTIMLVRADPRPNTLSMLSFPRDLDVPIYCDAGHARVTTDRINSAWSTCGAAAGRSTPSQKLTGIPVNYLITIDFHGFKLLVNKLHGVYMRVDHRYINTRRRPGRLRDDQPRARVPEARRPAGARLRPLPPHRLRRLPARAPAALPRGAQGPARDEALAHSIPELIGALKNNVEIGRGGSDGAPTHDRDPVVRGPRLPPRSRATLPPQHRRTCRTAATSTPRSAHSRATSRPRSTSFMHPDVTPPDRANGVALGLKPKEPKQPALKRVADHDARPQRDDDRRPRARHLVQARRRRASTRCSCRRRQLAERAARRATHELRLLRRGAAEREGGRGAGAGRDRRRTQLAPLPPRDRAVRAAGGESARRSSSSARRSAASSSIRSAHVVEPPVHQPPSVRFDPARTRTLARAASARKVPFRAAGAAHASSSGSRLAPLEPVRVSSRAAHKDVLRSRSSRAPATSTGRSSRPNWTSAPILRKPTDARHARRPQVPALHDRRRTSTWSCSAQGKASYWVVNTLRDELSNETMLAIAKGLQPLGK